MLDRAALIGIERGKIGGASRGLGVTRLEMLQHAPCPESRSDSTNHERAFKSNEF